MPLRKLREIDGSAGVTLPIDDLRRDGLADSDGELEDTHLAVDRVGDGEYKVKAVDGDDL